MFVATWNVWAMPFVSRPLMGRQHQWGKWIANQINELRAPSSDNELMVACFQEAWAFRAGILGWPLLLLATYFEECCRYCVCFSLIAQIVSVVCCCLVPCLRWDPKQWIARQMSHHSGCIYAIGSSGVSLRGCCSSNKTACCSLMDSGLLICANKAPLKSGFDPYLNFGPEEQTVNKGILWAVFRESPTTCTVVMTTHLTGAAPKGIDRLQLTQLRDRADELQNKFSAAHCIICGDFNYGIDDEDLRILTNVARFKHISSTERATCDGYLLGKRAKVIDHVFYRVGDGHRAVTDWESSCRIPESGLDYHLSDHAALFVRTKREHSVVADERAPLTAFK